MMVETLATTAAAAVIRGVAPAILNRIGTALGSGSDKVLAQLQRTFQSHVDSTSRRCAVVKTIFSEDRYLPLEQVYVNLYLSHRDKRVRDDDIELGSDGTGNTIIVGTGGAGKTMLMRYLALASISHPRGKIPVFIELRNLEQSDLRDFYRSIFNLITPERDHASYATFLEGLRAGVFTLFLDGLDEVPPDRREMVFRSIQRIALDFPLLQVISSTRPEIDVRSWEHFVSYRVNGLSHAQARRLIEKVDYPEDLKRRFLELLSPEFYDRHRTFLSVPLLCSLMLLTFNEFHEVPSRITVFYDQAFETLFRKHDTRKEGHFKRVFSTKLPSDRFRALFSAFCYRTLARQQVSFSDDELRTHLSAAARAVEIDVNVDDFCSDLVSSVCMIMRDGLKLHFIHRSFQDYFAAMYLLRYRGPSTFEVYDRVVSDMFISNVVEMLADLDLQAFEREWALPAVTKIGTALKGTRKDRRVATLIRRTFYSLRSEGSPPRLVYGWSWGAEQDFMHTLDALRKIYKSYGIISSMRYSCSVENDKGLCAILEGGIDLPAELKNLCKTGEFPEEGEDYVEIDVSRMPFEWLKRTSLLEQAETCISGISKLRQDLGARVKARDELDILA